MRPQLRDDYARSVRCERAWQAKGRTQERAKRGQREGEGSNKGFNKGAAKKNKFTKENPVDEKRELERE